MSVNTTEVKQIAAQILAGILANPHIYPKVSDEMVRGHQEQDLMVLAIEMAECLIEKVESQASTLSH